MSLLTELGWSKGVLCYRHGAPNGAEPLGQHSIPPKIAQNSKPNLKGLQTPPACVRSRRRYRVWVNIVCHSKPECSTAEPSLARRRGANIIHCKHRAQASRRAKVRSQASATRCRASLQELSPRL